MPALRQPGSSWRSPPSLISATPNFTVDLQLSLRFRFDGGTPEQRDDDPDGSEEQSQCPASATPVPLTAHDGAADESADQPNQHNYQNLHVALPSTIRGAGDSLSPGTAVRSSSALCIDCRASRGQLQHLGSRQPLRFCDRLRSCPLLRVRAAQTLARRCGARGRWARLCRASIRCGFSGWRCVAL